MDGGQNNFHNVLNSERELQSIRPSLPESRNTYRGDAYESDIRISTTVTVGNERSEISFGASAHTPEDQATSTNGVHQTTRESFAAFRRLAIDESQASNQNSRQNTSAMDYGIVWRETQINNQSAQEVI